jgi:apolipoprotein D and lipocalin family protein
MMRRMVDMGFCMRREFAAHDRRGREARIFGRMTSHIVAAILLLAGLSPSFAVMNFDNNPVPEIDPQRFSGKWYSLTSIPTFLDKDWIETIEHYTPREGGFDVHTTYRRDGETKQREISSKLFFPKKGPDGALKAQFFWPIKVPYSIIAFAPDGSWMVGGSPDKKMLFILARRPSLPAKLMAEILARCRELGYATEKLRSQRHAAGE